MSNNEEPVDTRIDETTNIDDENLTPEEQLVKASQEWVTQFRLKFCVREEFEITKNIIHPDGSINQE